MGETRPPVLIIGFSYEPLFTCAQSILNQQSIIISTPIKLVVVITSGFTQMLFSDLVSNEPIQVWPFQLPTTEVLVVILCKSFMMKYCK